MLRGIKLGVDLTTGCSNWPHSKWGNKNYRWIIDSSVMSDIIIGSLMRAKVAKATLYAVESIGAVL